MNKCCGLIGSIFGHKFIPRFDITYQIVVSDPAKNLSDTIKDYMKVESFISDSTIETITDGFRDCPVNTVESETYVYDICVRCGLTIKKS